MTLAAADLKVGMKVEAEGQFAGGVLVADKVDFRDNVRIEVAAAQQSDGDPLTVELRELPHFLRAGESAAKADRADTD